MKLKTCQLVRHITELSPDTFEAQRVVLDSNVTYENVQVWTALALETSGLPIPFLEDTMLFREIRKDQASYTIHSRAVSAIILNHPPKPRSEHGNGFDRLVLAGGASWGPGVIIDPEYYDQYGVPQYILATHPRQISFVAQGELILTSEYNISSIKNLAGVKTALTSRGVRSGRRK